MSAAPLAPSQRTVRRLLLVAIAALLLYLGIAVVRAMPMYETAKLKGRGWIGTVHQMDDELGFVPIPRAQGAHAFPIGDVIAMRFDADGFRIPVADAQPRRQRPLILALGDSCTYGDACRAEDAYPYVLAQLLGGAELNAGVCGYGLTQMATIAERLIPQFKPDIVVVQYSPWLVTRARDAFAPAYGALVPVPFLRDAGGDTLDRHPPIVPSWLLHFMPTSAWEYRDSPVSVADRMSFLLWVGLPTIVRNDLIRIYYEGERLVGHISDDVPDPERIVRQVYGNIAALCRANGARLVVFILGNGETRVDVPQALSDLQLQVVNVDAALFARLPQADGPTYLQHYGHFRGSPPQMVDTHPNPQAHSIIAQEVAKALGH